MSKYVKPNIEVLDIEIEQAILTESPMLITVEEYADQEEEQL